MFGFEGINDLCYTFISHKETFLDSSMVEHSAVNRVVVGSSPTRGAETPDEISSGGHNPRKILIFREKEKSRSMLRAEITKPEEKRSAFRRGPVVKRLRHRPFTAVTRVRIPSGSLIFFGPLAQLVRATGS